MREAHEATCVAAPEGGAGIETDRYLSEGDVVELEIDGIGVLRNTIGERGA